VNNFKPTTTVYIKLFAITLVPLIAGIIAFNYFKYTSSTLIIEMKVSQTGSGQVFWDTGKGYNESESYHFPLKGTDRFETYEIQLPASKLNSVRLDPMETPGAFEIESLRIKGSNAEYTWSGKKLHQDLVLLQNVKEENCPSDNFVGYATTDDPSLEIKNVPSSVFNKTIKDKTKVSVLSALGSFIIIIFLINMKSIIKTTVSNKKIVAATLISVLIGVSAFFYFRYAPSTLIVEMKTSNYGLGQVFWNKGGGYSEIESYEFLIKSTENFETYSISLPAKRLKALRIDPMQAPGDFEIKGLRIKGPDGKSEWSGRNLVQELVIFQNVIGGIDDSSGTFKGTATTNDPSLILRSIQGNEFTRPIGFRLVLSFLFACSSLIVICFIIRMNLLSPDNFIPNAGRMIWLIFIAVYLYYFYHIWIYAVDAPLHDEWDYYLPHALPAGLTLKWLLGFHNEHRIVFTKFLAWIFFKIDGLNFAHQQIFNYVIFGGLLAAVLYAKKVAVGARQFLFFPAFMIFLLSPIAELNHSWGFQSHIHFVVLFSSLATVCAFTNNMRLNNVALFLFFTLCSMFSSSSGVVFAAVYLICFSVYLAGSSLNGMMEKRKAVWIGISAFVIIGMGLLLWFKGFVKPQHHPPAVLPTTLKFWDFYLNILSHGYGFDSVNFFLGIPGTLISLIPLTGLLIRKGSRWQRSTWILFTLSLGIFGALAATAAGRVAFGIEWSKKSHYTEISFLLIPLAALSWWLFLEKLPKFRNYVLGLIWVFCFIGYVDNWSIEPYKYKNQLRLKTLNCATQYYKGIGNGNCPETYSIPIHERLDQARQLQVNFTKNILR